MLTTREIPIGDNNRATIELDLRHRVEVAATCRGQVSRDGKNWSDAPGLALRVTTPGVARHTAPIEGAVLRFVIEAENSVVSGDIAGAAFELSVRLDRA
jgi:hypothetical protein